MVWAGFGATAPVGASPAASWHGHCVCVQTEAGAPPRLCQCDLSPWAFTQAWWGPGDARGSCKSVSALLTVCTDVRGRPGYPDSHLFPSGSLKDPLLTTNAALNHITWCFTTCSSWNLRWVIAFFLCPHISGDQLGFILIWYSNLRLFTFHKQQHVARKSKPVNFPSALGYLLDLFTEHPALLELPNKLL